VARESEVMANPPQVETVTSGADKAKLAVAVLLLIGALAAYYGLSKQGPLAQWASLIVLLAAGVAAFFASEHGKALIAYGRDSWREVRKVVWPSHKEARQMTAYVFAFVVVMALFLWLTDKTLEWVLYDLVLGWKR
jgi:preprotein translocase subunit SecE